MPDNDVNYVVVVVVASAVDFVVVTLKNVI